MRPQKGKCNDKSIRAYVVGRSTVYVSKVSASSFRRDIITWRPNSFLDSITTLGLGVCVCGGGAGSFFVCLFRCQLGEFDVMMMNYNDVIAARCVNELPNGLSIWNALRVSLRYIILVS